MPNFRAIKLNDITRKIDWNIFSIEYPQKYVLKFSTPQNPKIENFKPQKILQSPLSLKI